MSAESQIREAIVEELKRQAANKPSELKVQANNESLTVNGTIDLDDLVMVVLGSVAGGP